MKEIKLFRFSLPNVEEVLYAFSINEDESYLRQIFVYQDGGDIPWEIYKKLQTDGKIERITAH